MARRQSPSPAVVTKMVKALIAAGMPQDRFTGVKVMTDGGYIILFNGAPVPIDELDSELREFEARRGQS